jgi:DtxR family transcriptional regulator, Mn-dependent transcriptional regulator
MKNRVVIEDALKHCHETEYHGQPTTLQSLAGSLGVSLVAATEVLSLLVEESYAASGPRGEYSLTSRGRKYARKIIRAHRLYETALARETGFGELDWHARAERQEHLLTDDEIELLATRLGNPIYDPHGDPIPTRTGDLPKLNGYNLTVCPEGWEGRIAHIEDEPPKVYNRIVETGLVPGMSIRVLESGKGGNKINADGRIIRLDHAMAALVRVIEFARDEGFDDRLMRLAALNPGEHARVIGLSPACRGEARYRMLDLGLVPGTEVTIDLISPAGDPVAYLVRGASLAFRREQAEQVYVHRIEESNA